MDAAVSKPRVSFEFEVEKIIGISADGRYQVQWAPAWVSKFHLVGCQHLIQEFLQEQGEISTFECGNPIEPVRLAIGENQEERKQENAQTSKQELSLTLIAPLTIKTGDEDHSVSGSVDCSDTDRVRENHLDHLMCASATVMDEDNCNSTIFKQNAVIPSTGDLGNCVEDIVSDDFASYPQLFTSNAVGTLSSDDTGAFYIHQEPFNDNKYDDDINSSNSTSSKFSETHSSSHRLCRKATENNEYSVSSNAKVNLQTSQKQTPKNLSSTPNASNSDTGLVSCEICMKRFPCPKKLKKHLQNHKAEKLCICEHCGRGFTRNYHLIEHRRLHTGEKPYECQLCGKTFAQRAGFSKHSKQCQGKCSLETHSGAII